MNSKARIALAGGICVIWCAIAMAAPPTPTIAAAAPAAAAGSQMTGSPPSPAHVWMAGHWNSEGGQWKWVPAHWDLPPAQSAVWVPGHWIQGSGGWLWMNGAWNVAEAPQSPAAPPQPPGQTAVYGRQKTNQTAAQNGQIVPMPAAPAPYVAGQYAPGVPMVDNNQSVSAGDYGSVDYDLAYPGYYWDGNAWAWGSYPGTFGVGWGWGPGYLGYGYGGWGHGYGRWGHGRGGWGGGRTHGGSSRGGFGGHAGFGHGGGGGRGR